MTQNPLIPDENGASRLTKEPTTEDLRKASQELKAKIAEAKLRNDMPINSALGNPDWEQKAADGRFDAPEEKDEE